MTRRLAPCSNEMTQYSSHRCSLYSTDLRFSRTPNPTGFKKNVNGKEAMKGNRVNRAEVNTKRSVSVWHQNAGAVWVSTEFNVIDSRTYSG